MDSDILFFFNNHQEALPLYEAFERKLLSEIEDVHIKVQKTQISFSKHCNFAFVSFLPVRKAAVRPKVYLVISFGLSRRVESPRIDAATEPYPNRWTHHVLIADEEEVDDELMGWIREAAVFAAGKRGGNRRCCI